MVEISPATGYFMEKSFFEGGSFQREGCFPAAIGNYLLVEGFSPEIAQDVVDYVEANSQTGARVHTINAIVRGALDEQFGRRFELGLFYKFLEDLPEGYRESVNELDAKKIAVPAIVLTKLDENAKLDENLAHMWVMVEKNPVKGIDVDGTLGRLDYSIDGYLKIEGLDDVLRE